MPNAIWRRPMTVDPAVSPLRILTIPPGRPFLATIARALLAGDLPSAGGPAPRPEDLPRATILLPTRRAARAMQAAFLEASGGRALLLPRLVPIGQSDEDLGLLAGLEDGDISAGDLTIPPCVTALERQLVLTRLVQAWSAALRARDEHLDEADPRRAEAGARTPAQAARLAADLATLIDMVETESVSLDRLSELVPEAFSEHWQKTLEFLRIVTHFWPEHLVERGLISPMDRRNRLILAEAERLRRHPPDSPMIVAGVTGSIPATVALLRVVASLPNGAVVLPGLDGDLDDASWRAVADAHPEHPQHGLARLLRDLGVVRGEVVAVAGSEISTRHRTRAAFVSEAMRPAGATEHWADYVAQADPTAIVEGLSGMSLVETPNAHDEAEVVALLMRHALETPGRTAALVSPDRLLARRVAVRLESWGIRVDDSAGRPFAKTVPGAFFELVMEAVRTHAEPAALMALLKHPLTRLGLDAVTVRRAARTLELAAFRTTYLGRGLAAVEAALERAAKDTQGGTRRHVAVKRLWQADWDAARDLIARLTAALAPLTSAFETGAALPLRALVAAHVASAEALTARPAEGGEGALWAGEAGEAASRLLAGLADPTLPDVALEPVDYPDFYRSLIAGESVRPRVPVHPRLAIWGPLEARLQQPDLVILGSLNEGTWPAAADPGAWLNRPMRQELGLPAPEDEIGRAAHDLTMLMGAAEVVMTRADKVDGAPTVPSRWLLRMRALLQGLVMGEALQPQAPWLAWGRARDRVEARVRVSAPQPRPALPLRPRRLSVSDIETWLANPYAIFARHVLGLEALPALGAEPAAQDKGQIVHEALSRFTRAHADALPADIAAAVMREAEAVLADYRAHPRVVAFWIPRLARFAEWLAAHEPGLRGNASRILAEIGGARVLEAPGGPFTLRARADRIDVHADGLVITDYKTGTLPAPGAVLAGSAPQLPLEAAIALAGGFADAPAIPVAALRFVRASGGEPPGEVRVVKCPDVAALAQTTHDNLAALVARFDDERVPYRAVRRARFKYDYDDYAQLARVAEWAGGEDDGEAGE